jgi:UDP-GlcNAc3NAcA epimerase
MKLLTVIGTRPQFIKYAAIASELHACFEACIVDTGQHYDRNLSGIFLEEFQLPAPTRTLSSRSDDAVEQMIRMMEQIREVIVTEQPSAVLCFGDTNSTLAAALTAVKSSLPVAHIEAGERNFTADEKRISSYLIPEETNRIAVDHVSSLLLCASQRAMRNLSEEHVSGAAVLTGDIMYDLYLRNIDMITTPLEILSRWHLQPHAYYYCTIHRPVNTDDPRRLKEIFSAFSRLDKPVIIALHPRTQKMLRQFGLYNDLLTNSHTRVIDPVCYSDSIILNKYADAVITDSGGVMREAYFNRVKSVCVDDTTAWIDVCRCGWSTLTGVDRDRILSALDAPVPDEAPPLFGDGHAVEKTIASLSTWLATLEI